MYPFTKKLEQAVSSGFDDGNFGLWFFKLVPLNERDNFKACGRNMNDKNIPAFYRETYNQIKKDNRLLSNLLEQKHNHQEQFCRQHEKNGSTVLKVKAELQSPLITGIGKTHPNEVGMTFDHTLGIPYLPATGIKGLVRLAHILSLIQDSDKAQILIHGDLLDDTHPESLIPDLFGGDRKGEEGKSRGNVIFMDAYPEKIPELHVDIMNPHYGDYYSDEAGQTPPADYLDPVPVQFLTVQKGTVFVFRAIVPENETWKETIAKAFHTALEEQGFGAKTAVGYGHFKRSKELLTGKGMQPPEPGQNTGIKTERLVWENVQITYSPGNQEIAASYGKLRATCTGKGNVPAGLHKKLFVQRKSVKVNRVIVETIGNRFKLIEIIHE